MRSVVQRNRPFHKVLKLQRCVAAQVPALQPRLDADRDPEQHSLRERQEGGLQVPAPGEY